MEGFIKVRKSISYLTAQLSSKSSILCLWVLDLLCCVSCSILHINTVDVAIFSWVYSLTDLCELVNYFALHPSSACIWDFLQCVIIVPTFLSSRCVMWMECKVLTLTIHTGPTAEEGHSTAYVSLPYCALHLWGCELVCVKCLWTVVAQWGIDRICVTLIPIATSLRGQNLYEIERWLCTVTPDSMSVGVAL